MRPFVQVALIGAGGVVAWLAVSLAVTAHEAATAADSIGADGMHASGDLLLFVVVFAAIARVPTGAAACLLVKRRSGRRVPR